jgi:hypothetical protein
MVFNKRGDFSVPSTRFYTAKISIIFGKMSLQGTPSFAKASEDERGTSPFAKASENERGTKGLRDRRPETGDRRLGTGYRRPGCLDLNAED